MGIIKLWFRFTSLPDVAENAPFAQREAVRRSRLGSVVLLVVIILVLMPLPTAIGSNDIALLIILLVVASIDCFALFVLNRHGRTTIAGVIAVFLTEMGLTSSIMNLTPNLRSADLPMFDLLVQGVCVAFALLPIRIAFLVPVFNIIFTYVVLHNVGFLTPELQLLVNNENNKIMSQAITLQIMASVVTALLVHNTTQAIRRADRAEEIAVFEQREVERQQREIQAGQQLEEGIKQILATLNTVVGKNDLSVRVPLAQENVLWRIGRAINNLLARLQGLKQNMVELERTKHIAQQVAIAFRERRPIPLEHWTGTSLDPLIIEMNKVFQAREPLQQPPSMPNSQPPSAPSPLSSNKPIRPL